MVPIDIDFRSHVPIYLQIMERIQSQLAAGGLTPGDQLPTVRQLAADLRVNFNTVARAYRLLDEAGIISTQQGRGTFVLEHLPVETADGLRRVALQAMTRAYLEDAARRGYQPDEIAGAVQDQIGRWEQDGRLPTDDE